MKVTNQKSRWPSFCQTFVTWLAKKIVKEDIDQLRSSVVSTQLHMNTLWSAGVRVLREFGYVNGPIAGSKMIRREVEWADLHAALNSVKSMESVGKSVLSSPKSGA
jgi:hypothetical protein